ncbi:MAG TPA: hypothetical protein PLX28_02190 [Candidatus Woesebacteria bacterium]|nr:hypothetical protein [Candidatus Woesebacteria bacterium]HQO51572.1 hypothetical protein [Candidatus Woesebacteria bacterium]
MIKIKTIKLLLPLLFFLLFLRPVKAQTIIPCGTPGIKKCTTTETGQPAYAVCAADGITWKRYACTAGRVCLPSDPSCVDPSEHPEAVVGAIDAPPGVAKFNAQADSGLGIILFFSNLIKLIAIVAGLWTMINFIIAGFTYVTSADNPSAIEKIGSKLSSSVIGLAIIVASYTIAAVIGLILFGDAGFIISPEIPTVALP